MLRSIFSTVSLHFPSFSIYLVSFEIHSPHFSLISNSICLIYPLSNFSNFYPIFFSHFLILLFDLSSRTTLYKYEFMGERGAGGVALMYG